MGNNAEDTRWLDATAQAELISTRAATSTELVDASIERIEQLDGPINAVIMRWFDRARHQAEAFDELPLESEHRNGSLCGRAVPPEGPSQPRGGDAPDVRQPSGARRHAVVDPRFEPRGALP